LRLFLHGGPASAQRRHQDGLDDEQDVVAARVVRPELRAFGRVEAALEESTEDGRFNARPIEGGRARQGRQVVAHERGHGCIGEKTAIEMGDVVCPEGAARGHGREQQAQARGEVNRPDAGAFDEGGEQPLREQPDVLGEQTEQEAHQDVGGSLGVLATPA